MDADNEKHEVPDRASDLVQVSVGSTKEQETLKEPPDGGRAWLVLVGCFCVSRKWINTICARFV